MNTKKIGSFLKELRKEKNLTQEQLSEIFSVSNRSVSRWENGVNMPDFDLVIEIADFFGVTVEEILDGERKDTMDDKKITETMLKICDFEKEEYMKISKRLCILFTAAVLAFVIYGVIDIAGLSSMPVYEEIADVSLGFVFGMLLVGVLMTSKYGLKIKAFKKRLINRSK